MSLPKGFRFVSLAALGVAIPLACAAASRLRSDQGQPQTPPTQAPGARRRSRARPSRRPHQRLLRVNRGNRVQGSRQNQVPANRESRVRGTRQNQVPVNRESQVRGSRQDQVPVNLGDQAQGSRRNRVRGARPLGRRTQGRGGRRQGHPTIGGQLTGTTCGTTIATTLAISTACGVLFSSSGVTFRSVTARTSGPCHRICRVICRHRRRDT
jgi:hypothetical protein